jgi:hypothetical protein
MKKKLLVCFASAVFALNLCACGTTETKDDSENADTPEAQETAVVQSQSPYTVKIDNAYSFSAKDGDHIVIELDYTNNSSDNVSFVQAFNMSAFQNGMSLEESNSWGCSQFDLSTGAALIQPGYTAKIYRGYKTSDLSSMISVDCTPNSGGEETKVSLAISNAYYEKYVETTTAAPTTVVVTVPTPAPAPAPKSQPQYEGDFVCLGRTMAQAEAQMTQAEKAIISNSSNSREIINEQYAKHGYCFSKSEWHIRFYGYDH